METISIFVNGRKIETKKGKTVLEASLEGGVYIPHICHHPDLKPVGTCGLCVVEIEGESEPVVSCTAPVEDHMVVTTGSPRIEAMRKSAMESLLADHPPDCTECSKYLNCELQSLKQYIGVAEDHIAKTRVKPIPINRDNPLFVHDYVRCIKCERCVRACNDLRGVGVLEIVEEGGKKRVRVSDDRSLIEAGCRFCGACVEVCPTGAMRDKEELMEGRKRRQALIPCKYYCPAQIDVPRYIRLIHEKKYSEATSVIREKVPFPKVLGYVCNHSCESVCRRGEVNEAVSIRELKRFAAENDNERIWESNAHQSPSSGKRVAVIGAGPAGLTAAYYLVKKGHGVTVFEALPQAGGMMRYGIPAYRLPRSVLDSEIMEIEKAGVEIRANVKIESLDGLMPDEGYDAALIAFGAQKGLELPIPGADLDGVFIGLDLLREFNLGNKIDLGKRILVLGGGNVAFDCARVIHRLGAEEVQIACLESRSQMPAACDEIKQGEEEDIVIHPSKTFTRILDNNGLITGVECLDVDSFEFDEEGRVHIESVEGSENIISADTVVFAIGQLPDIPESFDLDINERGLIETDTYGFDTSKEGVFAVGDAFNGTTSVVEAIASGRGGAAAIDRYLGGDGNIDEKLASPEKPLSSRLGPANGFPGWKRAKESCLDAEERLQSFCSVMQTMDEYSALNESSRCLRCDTRLTITPVKFWGEY